MGDLAAVGAAELGLELGGGQLQTAGAGALHGFDRRRVATMKEEGRSEGGRVKERRGDIEGSRAEGWVMTRGRGMV